MLRRVFLWVLELALSLLRFPTLMVRLTASTATTPTTRIPARLMAITALNGSTAASSSASAPGTDVAGATDTVADLVMDVADLVMDVADTATDVVDTATADVATVTAGTDMLVDAQDTAEYIPDTVAVMAVDAPVTAVDMVAADLGTAAEHPTVDLAGAVAPVAASAADTRVAAVAVTWAEAATVVAVTGKFNQRLYHYWDGLRLVPFSFAV